MHAAGLVVLLLVAFQQAPASDRISQEDFGRLMAAKAVVVVDTRDPDSFAAGHIPGALSLPDHELAAETPAAARVIDRLKASTQPVVVYCACPAEVTSLRYVRVLRDRGVRDVRALTGGWVDWFNAGQRVEPSH